MSIFDFPRINFKGTIQLNPGTANNDDYASEFSLPENWSQFEKAGDVLGLIDSKMVEARTYGMSDQAFIAWVQKAHEFDSTQPPPQTMQIIPAEWNYYGAMDSQILEAKVIGVQTGPNEIYSAQDSAVPLTDMIGADLVFSGGGITDVNSQGSPPATQFFIDTVELKNDSTTFISGTPSKGAAQWLNFYRNVNLAADGGAGGYVYHVIKGVTIDTPNPAKVSVGVIFRYYLYHTTMKATTISEKEALYEKQKTNPATLEIIGTFAPLYEDEKILTTPTGRLMVSNTVDIPTPPGSHNNGSKGKIALAPAVLRQSGNIISTDFVGTFPDNSQGTDNFKYDFGPVGLVVTNGEDKAEIGVVDYINRVTGDQKGWVFDFDISSNKDAQQILKDPDNATFKLVSMNYGDILEETDYYFVSNQQAIYTEQNGSGTKFLNQGSTDPATLSVYHRGQELSADSCPPITLWQYRSIPLQSPGNAEAISTDFKPGQPIEVNTSQPGNFLFTFTIEGQPQPPKNYSAFANPPFVTNAPSISLRILPNNEDFSKYYEDPNAEKLTGNELLTFDVVYEKVLRTYYLLYPAMNLVFQLNSEEAVKTYAGSILDRTDQSMWMKSDYMPRTRDMSASRRELLQAWCRKVS